MRSLSLIAALALFISASALATSPAQYTSGEVYLYGNVVRPPYVLTLHDGAVLINDVQVYPKLHPETKQSGSSEIPDSLRARAELSERAFALQRELQAAGYGLTDITPRLVEIFRAETAVVDSVTGVAEMDFWVWWKGEGQPEEILIRCLSDPSSRENQIRAQYDLLCDVLDRGCMVIIASKGNVYVPPNDSERMQIVRDEITMTRWHAVTDSTFERWTGRYLPATIARQFAEPLSLAALRGE